MMCAYAGATFEDVKYQAQKKPKGGWIAPKWERDDKPGLRDRNPLVQLPYVVNHATGEVVAQSNAVYTYLGRLLGLHGNSPQERSANEQVLFHAHSMFMEIRDLVYPFKNNKNNKDEQEFVDSLDAHFSTTLPSHYDKLEGWLRLQGTPFFAARVPCTADFHVWEILDQHEAMANAHQFKSPVARFGLLKAFYTRFRALPELTAYFESGDAKLPINNKMAFFR